MENLSEISGYVASTLFLLTFVAKDMRVLRTNAIFSNLAFIAYGSIEWLPPVLPGRFSSARQRQRAQPSQSDETSHDQNPRDGKHGIGRSIQ
jgi:hypothetical protein